MKKIFSFRDTSKELKEEVVDRKELAEVLNYKGNEEDSRQLVVVEFSWKIFLFVLLLLAVIFWGKQLSTIVIFVFLGFVFMTAAKPVVDWLVSKKISKSWAAFITYLFGILIFLGLFSIVIIPFISQLSEFIAVLPTWISQEIANFKGISLGGFSLDANTVSTYVTDFFKNLPIGDGFKNITNALSSVFNITTLVLTSLIFSVYMVLEYDSLLELGLIRIAADEKRNRIKKLFVDVQNKLGRWLLGQLTVSTIAGIFGGILLTIVGVPFALPLSVFIALFDAIPNIGATIGLIPTIIVSLITVGPVGTIIVIIASIVYQQIENNFIVPKIMGNALGIKPVIVMFGVVCALLLFGIFGALIAVPVMVLAKIAYEFYIDLQKLKAKGIV